MEPSRQHVLRIALPVASSGGTTNLRHHIPIVKHSHSTPMMVSREYQSPNAIPPRRSSAGVGIGHVDPSQPVLKPVPESNWIGHGQSAEHVQKHPYSTPPPSLYPSDPNTPSSGDSIAKHVQGTKWSPEKE